MLWDVCRFSTVSKQIHQSNMCNMYTLIFQFPIYLEPLAFRQARSTPGSKWTGRWGYRNYQDCNQLFFSDSLCREISPKFGLKPNHQTILPEDVSLSCYIVDVFALPFFTRKIMEHSTPPGSFFLRVSLPVKIPDKWHGTPLGPPPWQPAHERNSCKQ